MLGDFSLPFAVLWALGTVGAPQARAQSRCGGVEKTIGDSESERSGLNWRERGLLISDDDYGLRTCEFSCLGGLLA